MQTRPRYALTLTHMAYSTQAMTPDPEGAWVRWSDIDVHDQFYAVTLHQRNTAWIENQSLRDALTTIMAIASREAWRNDAGRHKQMLAMRDCAIIALGRTATIEETQP